MRIITLHPGFVLLLALTLVPVTKLTAGDRHAGTVLSVGLDSLVVDELGRAGTAHMLYVTVTPRTSIIVSQRNPQAPEFTDTNVKRSVRRRSLVVEPPNGRVPLRNDAEAERSANLARLTDSWEYHTPWERCITRGVPGGMFPAGYNNGYLILQTPEYIAIVYEMIHEARIIPLDGRTHVGSNIGLWNGDSRGRWDGEVQRIFERD